MDNKTSYALLEDLFKNPTLNECYMLGNLKFYDAYFEKIIQFDGWKNILAHPKKSINSFLKSNWKIGYLKEMFPYFDTKILYKFLKKIK